MSRDGDVEKTPQYGGRGLPDGYEPEDGELSEYGYAKLQLLQEADFVCCGTNDNGEKRKDDLFLFIFDHPDYEGGIAVPAKLGELQLYRATHHSGDSRRQSGDYWVMNEDVGVFEELPDWVHHEPPEEGDDAE